MCKSDMIVMIDSGDRASDSNSTSDFKIQLDEPMLIQDDHGIQLKSVYLPNTLKTVNAFNNRLYCRLGVLDRVVILSAGTYDQASGADLQADIQTAISLEFSPTPSLPNAAGTWKWWNWSTSSYRDKAFAATNNTNEYTHANITITFTQYDVNDGTCVFTSQVAGASAITWSYNKSSGYFESPDYAATSHHYKAPDNFYWMGIYGPSAPNPSQGN